MQRKTAIVLSGGGSKGDFEVGAPRYLYDAGIRPEIVTRRCCCRTTSLVFVSKRGVVKNHCTTDLPGRF